MNSLVLAPECLAKDRLGHCDESRTALAVPLRSCGRRWPVGCDRLPPTRVGADPGGVGVAHAVADLVVIADGIERLAFGIFGAALQ